jgi:CRISPR locus-related DNA-binding protein
MGKVLVSTLYSFDSIVKAITQESIESLYLLVDEGTKPKNQIEALKKIKDTYSKIIEIKEYKIPVYDILKITKKCVTLIDSIKGRPIVNVTPSRKTQAIGLLYACFKRSQNIAKIVYMAEETQELIPLPLLNFELSESQQLILKNVDDGTTISKLTTKSDLSRAMVYRILNTLKAKGLIVDTNEGWKITDSGRIALL